MRRATITLPDDLEEDLEEFIAGQPGTPSLASLAQQALRRFLEDPRGSGVTAPLLVKVLQQRPAIRRLLDEHGVSNARLFGSVVRGEEGPGSDIDLVVSAGETTTLFDLARLRAALEVLLDVPVDVVPDGNLQDDVREEIEAEAVSL